MPKGPPEHVKKLANQLGVVVRDHIPISIQRWKAKDSTDDSYVPDREKDMLWDDIERVFSFPEQDKAKVKKWAMTKMAEAFQTMKKNLKKNYLDKGRTPDFVQYPHLRDHWDRFVDYFSSPQGVAAVNRNKANASKKEYHHHMGPGGYRKARKKWDKMEEDLYARGITPGTADWPERSKQWFYAHGGSLNMVDGSLMFSQEIDDVAHRLVQALDDSAKGIFKPDRERDELTRALRNPEHPGRTRGKGVMPWREGFKDDADTYRSRKKKKDEDAEMFRLLEERLHAQTEGQSKMEQEMSQMKRQLEAISQGGPVSAPIDTVSPSQRRSSCASTGLPEQGIQGQQSQGGRYQLLLSPSSPSTTPSTPSTMFPSLPSPSTTPWMMLLSGPNADCTLIARTLRCWSLTL